MKNTILLFLFSCSLIYGQNLDPKKTYNIYIKSASGKILDLKDGNKNDGAKIVPEKIAAAKAAKFYVKSAGSGYYYIYNSTSKKVIDANKTTSSVSQWSYHGGDNQKWKLVTKPGSYYCIQNKKTGKYLDLSSKGSLIQYGFHGGNNQQFKFVEVTSNSPVVATIDVNKNYEITIKSASGKALDLKDANKNDGAKFISASKKNTITQTFKLKSAGNNYYYIYNEASNRVIDTNKKTSSVSQWAFHGGDNQKWKFISKPDGYYSIQNKLTGKYLDLTSKALLIQYQLTGNSNQQFKFVDRSFNMILASDPQYPRTSTSGLETDANKKESEKLNRDHVKSMNALIKSKGNYKGVIINGDITEYGHLYQLKKFKEIYNDLSIPMYLGLGNHDYEMNVNNTFSNQASNRMIEYMIENIKANKIKGADYTESESYKIPELVKTITGSLSYSWDVDNIHFVQLHNYPIYEMSTNDFLGSDAKRKIIKIKSSLEWLERDLNKARKEGKVIILNYLDSDEHWESKKGREPLIKEFTNMIFKYNVSAIFAGHYHSTIGESEVPNGNSDYYEKNGIKIPVLYCGSAVTSLYLTVKFDNNKMTVEQVNSSNGASTTSNSKSYTLYNRAEKLSLPRTSGKMTFFNEGAYVAKYRLSYKINNQWIFKDTGDMALGNKKSYDIPKEATSIWVKGESLGIVTRVIFNKRIGDDPSGINKCYKSYGALPNPKWNTNCN